MIQKLASLVLVGSLILLGTGVAHDSFAAPRADFFFSPADPDINTAVEFDAGDSTSSGTSIDFYEWDFDGDGDFEVNTEESVVSHLFDQNGNNSVSLRVTDLRGDSETFTNSIDVFSAPALIRREVTTPFEPNRVPAGSSFQVKVTVTFLENLNAPGLDEDYPENWRVSSVESDGSTAKTSEAQWLWISTISAGDTREIIYNVTVPSNSSRGDIELSGQFTGFFGSERIEIDVPGDTIINVF
jgi:PKD repeat protein